MAENESPQAPQSPQSQPHIELPRYRSHKEVWVLKIKAVAKGPDDQIGSLTIIPEEEPYAPFVVGRDYVRKHVPQAGGYYIRYRDGYESFSPASVFEEGHTRI